MIIVRVTVEIKLDRYVDGLSRAVEDYAKQMEAELNIDAGAVAAVPGLPRTVFLGCAVAAEVVEV